MVFKSDRQRKAMFARMNKGQTRSNVTPIFRVVTPIGFLKVLGKKGSQRLALDEFKTEREAEKFRDKLRKANLPSSVEKGRI